MKFALLGALGFVVAAPVDVRATPQSILHKVESPGSFTYGITTSGGGDLNGDGIPDWIVGAPGAVIAPGLNAGFAEAYSGVDGSVLHTWLGVQSLDRFGNSVSIAGDVNGDGFDDVIIGAPKADDFLTGGGSAHVYSGFDGSLLHAFGQFAPSHGIINALWDFGTSVSGAGDVNGDGFADVIVGAPRGNGGPTTQDIGIAFVFSGADGSVLFSRVGAVPEAYFGHAVSGAGDVNNDGFDDVIVGAYGETANGTNSGSAFVLSGVDGTELHRFDGPSSGDYLGTVVAGAGDTNGDGFADLMVKFEGLNNVKNPVGLGGVRVYSGQSGSLLHELFDDQADSGMGASLDGVGDVNGDGFDDFIVGIPVRSVFSVGSYGRARVFSGTDGTVLLTLSGHTPSALNGPGGFFGVSVSRAGDVNRDGRPDFLVGDRELASVYVFSSVLEAAMPTDLCNGDGGDQAGCTNCPCSNNATPGTIGGCLNSSSTSARLEATGSPSIEALPPGSPLDLRFGVTGAPPTAFCRLVSGSGVAPGNMANGCFALQSGVQALAFDGLRCAINGLVRHGGRPADAAGTVGITTNPWGGEGAPLNGIGYAAGFVGGQTRYFQVIYRDFPDQSCMRGLNTTQAIELTFSL